jgi:hypothetical protein
MKPNRVVFLAFTYIKTIKLHLNIKYPHIDVFNSLIRCHVFIIMGCTNQLISSDSPLRDRKREKYVASKSEKINVKLNLSPLLLIKLSFSYVF